MRDFVGGIYDGESRAFIPVAGAIAAVDIATGRLLWRRAGLGRPVAVTGSRLVTLAAEGKSFQLRLVDTSTGEDAGRIADFGMPDLAGEVGTAPDAVDMEADKTPEGLRLSWRLRRPYRGGAPPPADLSEQTRGETSGAIVLDPEKVVARQAATTRLAPDTVRPVDAIARSAGDPDVLALDQIGGTAFALRARIASGNTEVSLEARDASSGSVLWETPLSQHVASKPTPLRN
ncbi:PQQ-like beta-propeller repeat protein [Mesorhizobium sp. M0292]|uniref:hypothetical protein n=1 Tax=Mesorhizobium sp. M0292 TaxID=2956929 RepID=UPI00333547AE